MRLTIFGASGKVGSLVVEEALRRGYDVVAFVHSHDLFVPNNRLRVVKGDVYNKVDVVKAVKGSDAVISCLGSWGTPKKNVLTAAMQAIIPAMHEQKIKRIITLTGSGAKVQLDKPISKSHQALFALLKPFPAGKVFQDGEEHMRLLASSDLDWTIIRSPVMNNIGGAGYKLSNRISPFATIPRQAAANCMLDQLDSDKYLRQAPIIHRAS